MRKKTNCSDPAGQAISRRLFLSGCAACSACLAAAMDWSVVEEA